MIGASSLSALPTEAQPLTREGSIVGTLQYMAPEQLEGQEADARTDIFALGAVLYEMLTGRKAFEGKSQASLISAIMSGEPAPMATLQPLTPQNLEHVVRRCLAKDPGKRWQAAADVARELEWIGETSSTKTRETAAPKRWRGLTLAAASILSAIVAASVAWNLKPEPPLRRVQRYSIALPPGQELSGLESAAIAISPDGSNLVYTANGQVFLRPIDEHEARTLDGTRGATNIFFSPDGKWVQDVVFDSLGEEIDGPLDIPLPSNESIDDLLTHAGVDEEGKAPGTSDDGSGIRLACDRTPQRPSHLGQTKPRSHPCGRSSTSARRAPG
jgi:serine/threonine protein kinase